MTAEDLIPKPNQNRPIDLPGGVATEKLKPINPEFLFPEQRTLDQQTHDLMGAQIEGLLQPEELERDQLTAGVSNAGDAFAPQKGLQTNPLGGPVNTGFSDALQARSQRDFENTNREIGRTANLQTKTNRSDRAAQLSGQLGRFEQMKLQNYKYRMSKLEQAKGIADQEKAERGSLLGSILGLVGTAVGTFVGGPVGGAVGGTAGQEGGKALA